MPNWRDSRWTGRAVFLGTVVAILGITGGFAMASVLTSTSVTQTADFDQGTGAGVPTYPAPTLLISISPTSSCTSGQQTVALSIATPPTAQVTVAPGGTCAAGDFAEEFQFALSSTTTSLNQVNTLTITSQVGAGSVTTNTQSMKVTTAAPAGTYTGTLDVFVDYGSVNPPSGGITLLNVVVQ
ncbi:MAG: hypothetical protein L3K03_01980 [Thermoplasmata archaeon]|nr:hypothetical protein [Thermoplasmata archaeon]